MFMGEFTCKIDDKGRFMLPAKFREILQNDEFEYFCFGVEDLYNTPNELKGSEDTYFKMEIQSLEEAILCYGTNNPKSIKKNKKPRLNKYERKLYGNYKIKKARERWDYNKKWWKIYNSGKIVKFYKHYANQKIRTTDKEFKLVGRNYRKIFDYWWTID